MVGSSVRLAVIATSMAKFPANSACFPPNDASSASKRMATREPSIGRVAGLPWLQALMVAKPALADWWIEQEAKIEATFRSDRHSYSAMFDAVQRQYVFDFAKQDELADCFCGDGT